MEVRVNQERAAAKLLAKLGISRAKHAKGAKEKQIFHHEDHEGHEGFRRVRVAHRLVSD
jgi:hypothetical protein